jgi:hypothetical protein
MPDCWVPWEIPAWTIECCGQMLPPTGIGDLIEKSWLTRS